MSRRRELLERLFLMLEERGIPWCVLRNFDEVLTDGHSDVDLLTDSAHLENLWRTSLAAATTTGHRVVQRTRFVNHSWVFWDGAEGFVRIDVDTEVRWRWWPVLRAREVLAERVAQGVLFVPSHRHETAIIRTQVAWRGACDQRYARRLEELGERPAKPAEVRMETVTASLLRPARWFGVVRNFALDLWRWVRRAIHPPGLLLRLYVAREVNSEPIVAALAVLFPPAKSSGAARGPALWRCLFRGGLAISIERVPDSALAAHARTAARDSGFAGRRTFIGIVDSSGRTTIAHPVSGAMAVLPRVEDCPSFIAATLADVCEKSRKSSVHQGRCVVLGGLDGSGKTTFARQLCIEAQQSPHFAAVHYFHWIPPIGRDRHELPWPDARETPRKPAMKRNPLAIVASGVRLLKSVVLARLSWHLRVRPLVRRGALVILDRFVLNYWLDPDSVRYAGPVHWLEWARTLLPKPDLLLILDADADILLARKGELTREQISVQIQRLRDLPALTRQRLQLDARLPPEALAREAFAQIRSLP